MDAPGDRIGGCRERPAVTVIIPVIGRRPSLDRALDAVVGQDYPGWFEVLVLASAASEQDLPSIAARPGLRVLTHVPPLTSAAARNLAIGSAAGDALVFTDDDALAEPGWLSRLVEASGGRFVVSGSIVNGTPSSAVGTCEYLLDRLDLYPRRPSSPPPWHGDTANLLIPRDVWNSYGPFVDHRDDAGERTIGGTDTALTSRLRRDGLLVFAPGAKVAHFNRTRFRDLLDGQFRRGRSAAHLGRADIDHPGSWLLRRPLLAPVAVAARVFSVYRRGIKWAPELLGKSVLLLPMIVAALTAWGWGLATEGRLIDRQGRATILARPPVPKG